MKKEDATTKKEDATTKKEEATTKKPEAKESGATFTVNCEDIQKKRKLKVTIYVIVIVAVIVLAGLFGLIFTLFKVPVPRFMLDDVSLDPISSSKVLVKLSSTNPSSSTLYYSEMSLHVQLEEIFETERVYLQSTLQEPDERTTWTGVVARNNAQYDKPDGTFQVRDGVENGNVIAEVKIQKKSCMFNSKRLRVTCPVLFNLKDLTAVISRPMCTCKVI
ncbi:unnamed protein product [Eruca vesicaria subsp. sativa]|uniref:Late embryogenesis abundant protein LEA-2 subgroup domain-containing protein n=1 Tax=Eruca vesicaria subsp. sativa TaxID=29727 RepID=A0ABC8JX26_ERUVS|nr:unnamed protein product [Eruca vesicaria subsp. sativa]